MSKQELIQELQAVGYRYLREIEGRGICGLRAMMFTVGLHYGIDEKTYEGRYCFPSVRDAKEALYAWDGQGDPPGNWIKHKGGNGEYPNPLSSSPKDE